jgi:hypothetical protein
MNNVYFLCFIPDPFLPAKKGELTYETSMNYLDSLSEDIETPYEVVKTLPAPENPTDIYINSFQDNFS